MRDRSSVRSQVVSSVGPEAVALVLVVVVLLVVAVVTYGSMTGRTGESPTGSPVPGPSSSISAGG